jgi:XTP/dITP diphosphohydrolase
MTTLIIATRNRHKVAEIAAILGLPCLSLNDVPGAPPLVEDAETFAGNATRKALQLAAWLAARPDLTMGPPAASLPPGEPDRSPSLVLADDSGLEVDALQGRPGVHSARFAALEAGATGNSSDAENNARLLRLLATVPLEKRTARFRCVLALADLNDHSPSPQTHLFEGACEGRIRLEPTGQGGFGYDPLFVPEGFTQSFAELGESIKNQLSHRARALARLREWLDSRSA